jgi:hypothetical protein
MHTAKLNILIPERHRVEFDPSGGPPFRPAELTVVAARAPVPRPACRHAADRRPRPRLRQVCGPPSVGPRPRCGRCRPAVPMPTQRRGASRRASPSAFGAEGRPLPCRRQRHRDILSRVKKVTVEPRSDAEMLSEFPSTRTRTCAAVAAVCTPVARYLRPLPKRWGAVCIGGCIPRCIPFRRNGVDAPVRRRPSNLLKRLAPSLPETRQIVLTR